MLSSLHSQGRAQVWTPGLTTRIHGLRPQLKRSEVVSGSGFGELNDVLVDAILRPIPVDVLVSLHLIHSILALFLALA